LVLKGGENMSVIRQDTVQIDFNVVNSPFDELTKGFDNLKSAATSAISGIESGLNKLKSSFSNIGSGSGISKLKSDIEAGSAAISVAKDKFSSFNSAIKNIATHPIKTLDNAVLGLQMSTGRSIASFKTLASTKVDNLKTSLNNVKQALTNGETGAKGFTNALKNIGKISVSKLVTGFNNIKSKLTQNKSEGNGFIGVLKKIGSVSLEKLKSGFNSLKSVISKVKSAAQNMASQLSTAASTISSKIFSIKNAIMGLAVGTIGKSALSVVGSRQDITTQFEVLLGSADAAKQRVEELTTFAGQTPFTRDEIFAASKQLQIFTGDALSTGKSLQVIGDVAAGTGQGFEEVALWTGRLYDAMKSGNSVGEMTARLQEMGAISGEDRAKIEALAESGKDISAIWPEVEGVFSRFNGTMEKMSNNINNMLLSLKSFATNNILLPLGEGITAGLQPAIEKFREFKKNNAQAITDMGTVLRNFAEKICIPLFSKLESAAEKIILTIAKLKDGFSSLGSSGGNFAAIFNALKPVFDFIVANKEMVISALKGIATALGGLLIANKIMQLAKAFSFLASPIGLVIGIATILFMVFKNGAEPVMSFFQNLGSVVQSAIPKVMNVITQIVNSITTVLPQVLPILMQVILDLVNSLVLMLPSLVEMGINLIMALVQGIISAVPILLQQMPVIIQNLLNAFMQAIPMLIEAGTQLVNSLAQGLTQNLPILVQSAIQIIQSLVQSINQNLPTIIQAGIQLIQSIVQGFSNALPQIIQAGVQLVVALVMGLAEALPTIVQQGVELILALIDGIVSALPVIIQVAFQLILQFAMAIIQNLPTIIQAAVQIIVSLVVGLIQAIPKLLAAIPVIFQAFIEGIFSIDWIDVGLQLIKAIVVGIWDGIKSLGKGIWDGLKSIFTGGEVEAQEVGVETGQSYTTGIETGIDTSGLTGLGNETSLNFADGITSGTGAVTTAAQGLSTETQNAMSIAAQGTTQSAEEVAQKITDSFSQMTTQLEALPEKLTGVLTPIDEVVNKLSELPTTFATVFTSLPENVGNIATAATNLKTALEPIPAAIAPVMPALQQLQTSIVPLAQLFPQIATAAQNLLTAIQGMAEGFASLATSSQTLSEAFTTIPEKMNAIIPLCPQLAAAITPLVQTFLSLCPQITEVAAKFTELANALQTANTSVTAISQSFSSIATSMQAISEGITNFKAKLDEIPAAAQAAGEAAQAFIEAFKPLPSELGAIITECTAQIQSGFTAMLAAITAAGSQMVATLQGIMQQLQQVVANTDLSSAGAQLINGLANGITNQKGVAVSAAREVANAVNAEFDKIQKINSPSKVWYQKGAYLGEGQALGLESSIPQVKAAVQDIGEVSYPYTGGGYTPENSYSGSPNNSTYETNSYAPVFNLTLNGGNTDRETQRKVKRWIQEAMNDMFDSMSRKTAVRQV